MDSLPKTVTRQRRDCDLSPGREEISVGVSQGTSGIDAVCSSPFYATTL